MMASLDRLMPVFLGEAHQKLADMDSAIEALTRGDDPDGPRAELKRAAHTIKGNASMLELAGLTVLAGALEDVAERMAHPIALEDPVVLQEVQRGTAELRVLIGELEGGRVATPDPTVVGRLEQLCDWYPYPRVPVSDGATPDSSNDPRAT